MRIPWDTVTFFLSVPGTEHFRDELNLDRIMLSGNSLLAMPISAEKVRVYIYNDQEAVEVFFYANDRGMLSNAKIQVFASSFIDAETQAFNLVMPILSWWSYRHDVALDISAYQVIEEQTRVQNWMLHVVGVTKNLDFNIKAASKPEFRTLFASYREAVNATNTFYRFLCFYKVMEGVKYLRKQRKDATLAAGENYRELSEEKIPKTEDELRSSSISDTDKFQPYLGRKFTWVTDQLREVLRNAIAHLEPTAHTLFADRYEDIMKCERAMPVIKYISRIMLLNEIKADPDLVDVHIA